MTSTKTSPETKRRVFLSDILDCLSRPEKQLPTKYLYDAEGSRLFDAICEQPEYYPTRTELALMRQHAREMADRLGPKCLLIEFGSGSSVKTRMLLDRLREPAGYVPVDVSCSHLRKAAEAIQDDYDDLEVEPVCADFTGKVELPEVEGDVARRVVYFPGSTIGNFTPEETDALLKRIVELVGPGGGLLLGADLRKDIDVVEAAYNDAAGVTAAFSLNLLKHINRELGADFDVTAFKHRARYDTQCHGIVTHLVSQRDQAVSVGGERFHFAKGEPVLIEKSHKYDVDEFAGRAAKLGLRMEKTWVAPENYFSVMYFSVPN